MQRGRHQQFPALHRPNLQAQVRGVGRHTLGFRELRIKVDEISVEVDVVLVDASFMGEPVWIVGVYQHERTIRAQA